MPIEYANEQENKLSYLTVIADRISANDWDSPDESSERLRICLLYGSTENPNYAELLQQRVNIALT